MAERDDRAAGRAITAEGTPARLNLLGAVAGGVRGALVVVEPVPVNVDPRVGRLVVVGTLDGLVTPTDGAALVWVVVGALFEVVDLPTVSLEDALTGLTVAVAVVDVVAATVLVGKVPGTEDVVGTAVVVGALVV